MNHAEIKKDFALEQRKIADLHQQIVIDCNEWAMKDFVFNKLEQMSDEEKDEFRYDLWEYWDDEMFEEKYIFEFWENYLGRYSEKILVDFGYDEYCPFEEMEWGNGLKELMHGAYLGFEEFYNKHKDEWISDEYETIIL